MTRFTPLAAVWVLLLVTAANAQSQLAPRFKEGDEFKTKETVKTRQTLKLGGQTIDTAADTVMVSKTVVGQRNEEGQLPLKKSYESITSEITLPGGKKVLYNSAAGEEKSDDPNFQIILDRLKASKEGEFTVTLDRENHVVSVSGIPQGSGVNADEVKDATQQILNIYPDHPVKPGDQWTRELVMPLGEGQIFTIQRRYKYVGPEVRSTVDSTRRLEKVTATTEKIEYSIKPNSGIPGQVTKSDLKVESGESVLLFDPALGRTVELSDKMHVTGKFTLNIAGMDLDGELDLTMETHAEEVR